MSAQRAKWREWWTRLAALTIPNAHTGGGTQSASARGFIGYARDAAFLLDVSTGVHRAAIDFRHPDWDPAWDVHPETLLRRLEAWHAARVADDWGFDHAGEAQPGEWRDMPKYLEDPEGDPDE